MRRGSVTALAAACLAAAGCAAGDNGAAPGGASRPADAAAPAGIAGLLKETTPIYRLALPQAGPSTDTGLPAVAAAAREQALADAHAGNWHDAVVHFDRARTDAWCSPALVYNLAVAYQGKGDAPSAGLYFRAYLAMMPEAPDAPEVNSEIARIKQHLTREAERYRSRADALAEGLDATPTADSTTSLRARVYEQMATLDYVVGETAHGDVLMEKLRALRGMANFPEPRARGKGSLIDVYRRDLAAVGRGGDANGLTAWVLAANGDAEAASQKAREKIDLTTSHISGLLTALRKARAWDGVAAIDVERARVLKDQLKEWNRNAFEEIAGDMGDMFWDGRPDLAVPLARALRAYLEVIEKPGKLRFGREKYWSVLAVLYDLDAINTEIRDYEEEQELYHYPANVVSLFLAALAPPGDRARIGDFIERTARRAYASAVKHYDNLDLQHSAPIEKFFANALLVAAYLARGDKIFDEPTGEPPSGDFMRFLVEIGDGEGLVRIAPLIGGQTAFYELQRFAFARGDHGVASVAESNAAVACQGWRPRDTGQARAVWTALTVADQYATKPSDDIDIQRDLDAVARDRPEQLPYETSTYGILFRMMSALIGE